MAWLLQNQKEEKDDNNGNTRVIEIFVKISE